MRMWIYENKMALMQSEMGALRINVENEKAYRLHTYVTGELIPELSERDQKVMLLMRKFERDQLRRALNTMMRTPDLREKA